MKKVLLTLFDGCRPDAVMQCEHPLVKELLAHSVCSLQAKTVMPSVTLPCHMSLFHSVTPDRHGILSNTYVPQVRPVKGLVETLADAGKSCAFFTNWEELRDLSRPDKLLVSEYFSQHRLGHAEANRRTAEAARRCINEDAPDFVFHYFGWTDEAGHGSGWMSDEYFEAVNGSFDELQKTLAMLPDDYLLVFTADHGGHGRSHGTDAPEDMTIPLFFYHKSLAPKELAEASILDIAPTAASVIGVPADPEWEGRPVPLN